MTTAQRQVEQVDRTGADGLDPRDGRVGYRRVLLKLGGEMFGGGSVGVDPDVVQTVASQIAEVARTGVQIAVVIGGGNFFRGAELSQRGMERDRADYMAMPRSHLVEWLRLPGDLIFIGFGAIPLVIAAIKGWLGVRADARAEAR